MKTPAEIEKDIVSIDTVNRLSAVFEGIASMRLSQIKDLVLQSQEYFNRLWQMYTQIRVDNFFHFGRHHSDQSVVDKELIIAITGEGGFSGDVDYRLIREVIELYDDKKNEIIVIGHHGAMQLVQAGIKFRKYFKLPTHDQNINVEPIVREVQHFKSTVVFFQSYVSLMNQEIKSVNLSNAVESRGKEVDRGVDIISEQTYIFEPSMYAVVDHLESSMMKIALSQFILESKLAQFASRFRAMSLAHQKSQELVGELAWNLSRTKRAVKDERLKEITNGITKSEQGVLT